MKNIEELKKIKIEAEVKSYVLFPKQEKGEIFKQDYDLLENSEIGKIDEDGEFSTSSDGEWYRISWWDGSSTSKRWAYCDELEFLELVNLGHEKVFENGTFCEYETYFKDIENDNFYVKFSDTTQKITQELILIKD